MTDQANFEFNRRKKAADGHEIIDKATYNKLTRKFLRHGGIIIRGEEADRYLKQKGAFAAYIVGGNIAIIADDATVSDVLEEMYHAYQDRVKMFGDVTENDTIIYRREIDAQKYLLKVSEKYKIPAKEIEVTKANLEFYERKLAQLIEEAENYGEE